MKYDHFVFIGSKANERMLKRAAGKEFVIRRGDEVVMWFNEHLAMIENKNNNSEVHKEKEPLPLETQDLMPKEDQSEGIGAL